MIRAPVDPGYYGKPKDLIKKNYSNDNQYNDVQPNDNQLKELSRQFESIFIDMVFKQMKKTVPKDGFIEESSERQLFDELLTHEMSQELANSGGIGLADKLYKQLKVLYEVAD